MLRITMQEASASWVNAQRRKAHMTIGNQLNGFQYGLSGLEARSNRVVAPLQPSLDSDTWLTSRLPSLL